MKVCTACGSVSEGTSRFCVVCGNELPDGAEGDPLVGKLIGGSFVVRELIGVGGMGRVYRGEQNTLGRSVAIKVIHPHLLSDEQTVQRFYTEARASSRLNHPNSVSVIDFGRSDEGVLYLVMEHLAGRDLAEIMAAEAPLAPERVIELVSQTLDALGEAHEQGIVHRDLKPENVFVVKSRLGQERVKVLDFGLATIVGSISSVTRPGLVCGTPSYMSPEQARGDQVDARSDLYSVGAMLFELLTDHPPFQAETPVRILMKHVHDPIPDPRAAAPGRDISFELASVVMRALAKDAGDRYQTSLDLKNALLSTQRPALAPVSSRVSERPRICVSCGATNDASQRYCGSCGARLPGAITGQGAPVRRSIVPVGGGRIFPFVGRDAEMAALVAARDATHGGARVMRIVAEPGMGASRFVEEVLTRFSADGDLVASAEDHPSGVQVAYAMANQLVRDLLNIPDDTKLLSAAPELLGPIARAGLAELDSPVGLRGVEGGSRAAAVGSAIAWAARQSLARAQDRSLVIALDDFATTDEPSRAAFEFASAELKEEAILWIVVGGNGRPELPLSEVHLGPLGSADAFAMLAEEEPAGGRPELRASPRVLAQISVLGERLADIPARELVNAADLAMARFDRLDAGARRTLQALAVLGRSTTIELLTAVSGISDSAPLTELRTRSLVSIEGSRVSLIEPFIAELVEAMIPAEARRMLHERALDACEDAGAPNEVIAEHAAFASLGIRSLLTLERSGDVSMKRGDVHAAVRIYRLGVDLARRESLASGESMFDSARVTFGRKLGEAMAAIGDTITADGILREIVDLPELDRLGRARVHLALARVSRLRGRLDDASRQLVLALDTSHRAGPELEAQVQFELGELRETQAHWEQAVDAFREAADLLTTKEGDRTMLARVYARLALCALSMSDFGAFVAMVPHVEREAARSEAFALAGRVHARAALHPIEGVDIDDASARALELSCEAGDAETFRAVVSAH